LISKHRNMTVRRSRMRFLIMFVLLPVLTYPQEMPDFGPDGLARLTLEQKQKLARYGSRVSLRFIVPGFIQTALAKNNLPRALQSVRKYVNSGGTWQKNKRTPS